jgi:hypothetical protein
MCILHCRWMTELSYFTGQSSSWRKVPLFFKLYIGSGSKLIYCIPTGFFKVTALHIFKRFCTSIFNFFVLRFSFLVFFLSDPSVTNIQL